MPMPSLTQPLYYTTCGGAMRIDGRMSCCPNPICVLSFASLSATSVHGTLMAPPKQAFIRSKQMSVGIHRVVYSLGGKARKRNE